MATGRYITSDGKEVEIRSVSLDMVQQIAATQARKAKADQRMNAPTYTVKTATGDTETHVHDEVTIEDDRIATPEARAAWGEYQKAQAEHDSKSNVLTMRYILFNGVVTPDEIPQEWFAEMEWNGAEVPDDERERRWLYIRTAIIPNVPDQVLAMMEIMSLSGADTAELEAKVGAYEDLFRRKVERKATGKRTAQDGAR